MDCVFKLFSLTTKSKMHLNNFLMIIQLEVEALKLPDVGWLMMML